MIRSLRELATLTTLFLALIIFTSAPSIAQSNDPCVVFPGMCGDGKGQGWENGYKGWLGYYPWDSSSSSSTGYRAGLIERTGHTPSCSWFWGTCDAHAHHIFPKTFQDIFWNKYRGFNINDPRVTIWWSQKTGDPGSHLSNASAYNRDWQQWMNNNQNASFQQVLQKGQDLMFNYSGQFPGKIFGGHAPRFAN